MYCENNFFSLTCERMFFFVVVTLKTPNIWLVFLTPGWVVVHVLIVIYCIRAPPVPLVHHIAGKCGSLSGLLIV